MNIVKVPFHGHELTAIETAEAVMVPLKPICDKIGVDVENQRKKVRSRQMLFGSVMLTEPALKTARPILCLPVTRLAMWLASINPAKVKPELRSMLELYQREAADVLDRHFRNGEAIPARAISPLTDPEPPLPKITVTNPMRQWQGFEMVDYIEYLQLKAWALEVENRRLRRRTTYV